VLNWPYRSSLAILLFCLILFFIPKWGDFPTRIHAWTQSDRIALSYCFVNNGLNLFKPCTYDLGTKEGVTPAGLPISEYVGAVLMRIFGKSVAILNVVHLLFFSLGLFFLERIGLQLKLEEVGRFAILGMYAFSPSLVYYGMGVLPSVPSLALFIAGFSLVFGARNSFSGSHVWLATLCLFLSITNRWSYFIPVMALLASLVFPLFNKGKKVSFKLFPSLFVALSIVFGLLWFWKDQELAAEYGSAFLMKRMAAENLVAFVEVMSRSYDNWGGHWMSRIQVIWAFFLLATSLWQSKSVKFRDDGIALFFPLSVIGGLLYFVAMIRQFEHHDYYFIDAFFPSILIGLLLLYPIFREKHVRMKKWFGYLSLTSVVFWALAAKYVESQRDATGLWNKLEVASQDFESAVDFLNEEHVREGATLFVPNAFSTNIPHLRTGRRGYALVNTDSLNLDSCLNLPFDFALIQNRYLHTEVLQVYPSIPKRLEKVADNGWLSLYRKGRSTRESFLGLDRSGSVLLELSDSKRDSAVYCFNTTFSPPENSKHAWLNFDLQSQAHEDFVLYMKSKEASWRFEVEYGIESAQNNEIYLSWPPNVGELEIFLLNPHSGRNVLTLSNLKITAF
jgi:hypothetical protein